MATSTVLQTLLLSARLAGVDAPTPAPTPTPAPVDTVSPVSYENHLAPTPPMGWNSWNHFHCDINDGLIRAQADAMASNGMRAAGYEYVNIDDCWEGERDKNGVLHSDARRFPDMKALADYVHSRGLKIGIYTDAGPRTCQLKPASKDHEEQDAKTFAQWGIDYVKEDWCNTKGQDPKASYAKMAAALLKTGRPIVFSICNWGHQKPWEWGADVGGNLWRTWGDIEPKFSSVLKILDFQAGLAKYARPGHWNDPDMLEVGNGMTQDEDRAHFSLWAILAAPLISGNDLTRMSPETTAILTNPEVIAVDQDPAGVQGTRVRKDGDAEVWARPLQDGSWAAVLFNRGTAAKEIAIDWKALGLGVEKALVRDLWRHEDLGAFDGRFGAEVGPHGVVMVKLTPVADAL